MFRKVRLEDCFACASVFCHFLVETSNRALDLSDSSVGCSWEEIWSHVSATAVRPRFVSCMVSYTDLNMDVDSEIQRKQCGFRGARVNTCPTTFASATDCQLLIREGPPSS